MNGCRVSGFYTRLFAYLIDVIAIAIISTFIIKLVEKLVKIPSNILPWISLSAGILGIVGFCYFVFMTKKWSQTIGKMILGIRVIKKDGSELDWGTVILREVIGRTVSQFFGSYLGYIAMIFNSKKIGIHDFISDTYVVYDNFSESKKWIIFEPIPTVSNIPEYTEEEPSKIL